MEYPEGCLIDLMSYLCIVYHFLQMEKPTYDRIGRTLSLALHPFVIPMLASVLLLFGPTIMAGTPPGAKWFLLSIVTANTLILPFFSLVFLHTLKIVPDFSMPLPRQRIVPLAVTAVCYGLCIVALERIAVAFLLKRFMIAALCCVLAVSVVNLRWKISLHMTSAGGLLGMLAALSHSGLANFQFILLFFILAAGALACARLYMGCHTIAQIAAGTFAGMSISWLVLSV